MKRSLSGAAAICFFAATSAAAGAQSLPAIKVGGANAVPECVTPGRLMALLAERNPKLDPRFAGIATIYMRHGEAMGLRWDYAFYQMMLETGSLSFMRNATKPGDVKPKQNNFAGLGATGKGAPGESFSSIDDGVKAHLQHLALYSGEQVEEPVAERTRKVQEWGVLTSWQKGFKRPITFADLAAKWAPGSRGYSTNVQSFHASFHDEFCKKPDPNPALVQEARSGRTAPARKPSTAATAPAAKSVGVELANKAGERARSEGAGNRSSLGGRSIIAAQPYGGESAPAPGITVLNEQAVEAPKEEAPAAAEAPATRNKQAPFQTANAAGAARTGAGKGGAAAAAAAPKATSPAAGQMQAAPVGKCRVYTASYGGQKAVIIRANAEQFTNFTVLDVNEGQEAREIDAYIATHAKGGQKVGDFSSSSAALDKAFELCPEG